MKHSKDGNVHMAALISAWELYYSLPPEKNIVQKWALLPKAPFSLLTKLGNFFANVVDSFNRRVIISV
jgi:hypothetical protein